MKNCLIFITLLFCSYGMAQTKPLINKRIVYTYAISDEARIRENLKQIDTFYYNKDKKLLKEVQIKISGTNRVASHMLYEYEKRNNEGKILEIQSYYIHYTPAGNISEKPRQLKERWEFIYDNAGNNTETKYYIKNDGEEIKQNQKLSYTYNKKGEKIEAVIYGPLGDVWFRNYFNYKKGKLISTKEFDGGGKLLKHVEYNYNGKGDVIKETEYNSAGNVKSSLSYKYTYNKWGNYTQKQTYEHKKMIGFSKQEFEYYE